MQHNRRIQRGFTLVEMIMVMVITGIIGGMVAIFIKAPVQGYVDSARRAEMTDIADTALRRLARDIRTAVPNSVRPAGSSAYIEFLPTRDGGRYRANATGGSGSCAAAGDNLSFDAPDTCFEILGPSLTFAANDEIVVGSTQSDGKPPYASCAATPSICIRRAYAGALGAATQKVVVASATTLPAFAELSSQRFEVVPGDQQAVTYYCETPGVAAGEGTGTLWRYWNYGFNAAQVAPPVGGKRAILADRISTCSIAYNVVNQRNGLVAITLGITRGGESVSLYHEIHVNNAP